MEKGNYPSLAYHKTIQHQSEFCALRWENDNGRKNAKESESCSTSSTLFLPTKI